MECFTSFRAHLAMSGIIVQQSPLNSHRFCLKNLTIIIMSTLGGIATNKLISDASNLEEYADIIYRTFFVYIITTFYVYVVWKTKEFLGFMDRFEKSINKRIALNAKLQSLYTEASQRIQKWMNAMHIFCTIVIPPLCTLPSVIASFYAYFTTDLGNDAFQFLYPMWFPFDTNGPIRFSMAIIIQFIIIMNIMITIKFSYLIGVATLPLLFPMIDDIKRDLNTFQQSLKDKSKRKRMAKPLSQFIQFHSDTRQLAHDFSNFWRIILLMFGIYYIVEICCLLILIEMKMNANDDPVEIIKVTAPMLNSLAIVFAICELGERVRMGFDKIRIKLDQLKWYLIPIKTRKMLLAVFIVAQEPVDLTIFGSISSNRIMFKEICHKIYALFMMIQRLYN